MHSINALILLPLVHLSLEIDTVTSISYMTWKLLPSDAEFVYFGDFSLRVSSFNHITTSGLI